MDGPPYVLYRQMRANIYEYRMPVRGQYSFIYCPSTIANSSKQEPTKNNDPRGTSSVKHHSPTPIYFNTI